MSTEDSQAFVVVHGILSPFGCTNSTMQDDLNDFVS